ncbi:MAG: hypothetical protein J1F39_01330 [Clostridiales bacterium]|nr:hypothetical protein [Clostridiales bacterium]
MNNVLRVWVPAILILIMTLYFYGTARRIYDIILSFVLLIVTSPVFAVLAIASTVKTGHAFDYAENDLTFAYPDNKINTLPRLVLVLIGKRRIMPKRLRDFKLPE